MGGLLLMMFGLGLLRPNLKYYSDIFTNGNKDFAIRKNAQPDTEKLRQMTGFFFLDGVGFGDEQAWRCGFVYE
jgi:hypothetical protein